MKKDNKIYCVYKGDEFVDVGTKEELAKRLGIKPNTIYYYSSKSYKNMVKRGNSKRIEVYIVED